MSDQLQSWIDELLDVKTADVVYSFSPDQLGTLTRTAHRLISALVEDDILSRGIGSDRSNCDGQWFVAASIAQGGSPLYYLIDEIRKRFKGNLGVDTSVLAQCASIALERRHHTVDRTLPFWSSKGHLATRLAAERVLCDHPELDKLLVAALTQWNAVLQQAAARRSASKIRLHRTIATNSLNAPLLYPLVRATTPGERRCLAQQLPHRGLSAWTVSPAWARGWRHNQLRVMLTADVDVAALMCTPMAGEGEFLVTPYITDSGGQVRSALRICSVTVGEDSLP